MDKKIIYRINEATKQASFDQLRNKLGGTAYNNEEGLSEVTMENQQKTIVARKLAAKTKNDNLETRMRASIEERKASIKQAKRDGRMDPNEKVVNWAFDLNGNLVEEYI